MKNLQYRMILMMTLAISLIAVSAGAADEEKKMPFAVDRPGHLMVFPPDLKWSDVPSMPPGAKVVVIEGDPKNPAPFMFRLKFPSGYKIPVHAHPTIERVTVISGIFNLGIGDKFEPEKANALNPGSIAIMPPGMNMFAYTKEETIIQVHGIGPWGLTYLNPEDDPRKK